LNETSKTTAPESTSLVEALKSLTRPALAVMVVGAWVVACFVDLAAAEHLETLAKVAFGWWFIERGILKGIAAKS